MDYIRQCLKFVSVNSRSTVIIKNRFERRYPKKRQSEVKSIFLKTFKNNLKNK